MIWVVVMRGDFKGWVGRVLGNRGNAIKVWLRFRPDGGYLSPGLAACSRFYGVKAVELDPVWFGFEDLAWLRPESVPHGKELVAVPHGFDDSSPAVGVRHGDPDDVV